MNSNNHATITTKPLITLYTVSTGGDQGEDVIGIFYTMKDAFDCAWESIQFAWLYDWLDLAKNTVFNFEDEDGDGTTPAVGAEALRTMCMKQLWLKGDSKYSYLFNGSKVFTEKFDSKLSSDWWYITKQTIPLADNLAVNPIVE